MIKKVIALIALLVGLGFIMIPYISYDALKLYNKKRNFSVSPEPKGKKIIRKSGEKSVFVVQKHNASHLHYDFRLEINGVLKSWAVPKGLSTDPHDKRLAIETEDHPIEYATFEGIIPEGNYGAGSVVVWDTGTFENIKEKDGAFISLEDSYKNGQIEVFLHGKKLQGAYALIRTTQDDDKNKWLCIKMNDEYADARRNPIVTQPESVLSGKTTEQLEGGDRKAKKSKKSGKMKIKINRFTIEISNYDKVLFGKSGITKGELIEYYAYIAPIMIPHCVDRPISMHRFPEGIHTQGFYQKDAGDYFPEWIKKVSVPHNKGAVDYVIVNNAATLVYLANQACITPHTWLSRSDKLDQPDRIIFDLDPSPSVTFADVQWVAQKLKILLDSLQLPSYYMLTGSRGMHVVIPLKRLYTFDQTRSFAHDIAELLAQQYPEKVTIEMSKKVRGKRVFIDWLRNGFGATGVAPYAVRAIEGAPVAMPVTWDEASKKGMTSQKYTIKNAKRHIKSVGDVWHNMHKNSVSLTKAKKLFNALKK